MNMRYLFGITYMLICLLLYAESRNNYIIKTQEQFDEAVKRINRGEEMHITLHQGQYVLNTAINAKAPLFLKGKKATITCMSDAFSPLDKESESNLHNVYRLKTTPSLFPLFTDENGRILPISESIDETTKVNLSIDGVVGDVDMMAGATVKIPIPANLKHLRNKLFEKAFGYFDCGWQVVNFSLEKSDGQYFYCKTLDNCRTGNYSYEKTAYRKPVRYVIYNAEVKPGAIYFDNNLLYIPTNIDRVMMLNKASADRKVSAIVTSSDVVIRNIRFMGFSGITIHSKKDMICSIKGCEFCNSLGYALNVDKENGKNVCPAIIKDCIFRYCAIQNNNVVLLNSSFFGKSCITISSCSVARYPEDLVLYKNVSGAVYVNGDVTLVNNVVNNTPRCHLYFNEGQIVARGNVLYNSSHFNEQMERNTGNDWGLVYCNQLYSSVDKAIQNKTHSIKIENNLLYGAYSFGGDARGIFIDDGRGDVECVGNIILDTQLYSLDCRNEKGRDASSVRNRFVGNIVTTRYRMGAGNAIKGSDVPSIQRNILLAVLKNEVSNINVVEGDVLLDVEASTTFDSNRIIVSKEMYDVLRKSAAWKSIMKYIGRQ